jgi:hypothetical protein
LRHAVLLLALGLAPATLPARSGLCRPSEAVRIGQLDPALVNEASGLAASAAERLYHINDSGDSGRFFVTTLDGGNMRQVRVEGFDPVDTEDLALGSCGEAGGTCLFIADFGDNNARRPTVEILTVREQTSFPDSVQPERRIRFRYADGPHDAESLAIHPDGDLLILTKTIDLAGLRVPPSGLYRIPYGAWSESGDDVLVAERIGELPLPAISRDPFRGSLPTAMDISADGRKLLVLTYTNAFELPIGLASGLKPASEMVEGVDFVEIPLTQLRQQEAIAYLPDGGGFIYTSEAPGGEAPIMRVDCRN